MSNHLLLFFILTNLYLTTTCLIIHTQRLKTNEEICAKNHLRSLSTGHLRVCYVNNNQNHSIFVWFQTDVTLLNLFHQYRFILRSIDKISLATLNIYYLTNFTELVDFNNSLRLSNLDLGQYELCIEFQSNLTSYIYSPHNGCLSIRIGELIHGSFKQSSTQLFIALAIGIIIFLILGLVVQWIKGKEIDKCQQLSNENNKNLSENSREHRFRSSSFFSTVSLRQQSEKLIRQLCRRHFDQLDSSAMQRWARNRAFRHRISIQEQENKQNSTRNNFYNIHNSSSNDIYTIPINERTKNVYFT